jgi:hypothetical protein
MLRSGNKTTATASRKKNLSFMTFIKTTGSEVRALVTSTLVRLLSRRVEF